MNKHKELAKNLTEYYANYYTKISRRVIKDIIVETMAQTSLLAINDLVSHDMKNDAYKEAIKNLTNEN